MANKLFITCPFSCMETFLLNQYGNDIYFLTCSGAVLQYEDFEYISEVKRFIFREKIKTILIVNDTSCRFINGIIKKDKIYGLKSEMVMEELYVEHYCTDFNNQSIVVQQMKLAEFNIKWQANELMNNSLLGSCISEFGIEIKGLITSKKDKYFQEFRIESNINTIYKL